MEVLANKWIEKLHDNECYNIDINHLITPSSIYFIIKSGFFIYDHSVFLKWLSNNK